jgi:Domain of unknown function (DUF4166)
MIQSRPAALYRRLMGASFEELPMAVQTLHGGAEGVRAVGRCDVRRGRSALSRLIAGWLGVPEEGDAVDLQFEIVVGDRGEKWVRRFGSCVMRSHFWEARGQLYERLGPVVMLHALELVNGGLHTRLRRLWFLGIPVPRTLHPRIRAVADQEADLYRFDVTAEMPMIGLIVSYRGHLEVAGAGAAA